MKKNYEIRGNQISHGRPWTESEMNTLKNMAGFVLAKLLAKKLNRSYESVRQMAKRKGIRLLDILHALKDEDSCYVQTVA